LSETLSTLRFGQRAKKMKNKPVVNRVRSIEELEKLLAKAEIAIDAQAKFIELLQQQIADLAGGGYYLDDAGSEAGGQGGQGLTGTGNDGIVEGGQLDDSGDIAQLEDGPRGGNSPRLLDSGAHAAAAGSALSSTNGPASSENEWGDPASWTAASPPPRNPQRNHAGGAVSESGGGAGAAALSTGGSPRRNSFAHSVHEGGLGATATAPSFAVLMELSALRDEAASLRELRRTNEEELASKEEEIRDLTTVLSAKEHALATVQAEQEAMVTSAKESGAGLAISSALASLRRFQCNVCACHPFSQLADLQGLEVLHEQQCFQSREHLAAYKRLEGRATVLQAEVDNLRTVISTTASSSSGSDADGKSSGNGESGNSAAEASTHPSATAAPAANPFSAAGGAASKREVVDARVMVDLQGKLASLVHVHRQLLRKYAVVDVECGEMQEAIKSREERISELTRAALAHNVAVQALRESYENKLTEQSRAFEAQMNQLRRDFSNLRSPNGHAARNQPKTVLTSAIRFMRGSKGENGSTGSLMGAEHGAGAMGPAGSPDREHYAASYAGWEFDPDKFYRENPNNAPGDEGRSGSTSITSGNWSQSEFANADAIAVNPLSPNFQNQDNYANGETTWQRLRRAVKPGSRIPDGITPQLAGGGGSSGAIASSAGTMQ
jgi:hypothetical protein